MKIVVIDDGRVREHGPREEILPKLFGDEKADVCLLYTSKSQANGTADRLCSVR